MSDGKQESKNINDFDALQQALSQQNLNLDTENKNLSANTAQLQQVINTLNDSHVGLHQSVTGFIDTINKELQIEDHLVNDIQGMVKSGPAAIQALEQIEAGRDKLKKQVEQTQQQLVQVNKSLKESEQKTKQLSTTNQQLVNLHNQQIQKIQSNVSLLKKLNEQIQLLQQQANSLKQKTDPNHSILKYYLKYPFLIKIYNQFEINSSSDFNNTVVGPMFNKSIENLTSIITVLKNAQQLATNVQKVNTTELKFEQVNVGTFWQGYIDKIQLTKKFWEQNYNYFITYWQLEKTKNQPTASEQQILSNPPAIQ